MTCCCISGYGNGLKNYGSNMESQLSALLLQFVSFVATKPYEDIPVPRLTFFW